MILRELLVKLGLDIDEAKFAKGNLAAEVLKASFVKVIEVSQELAHTFFEGIQGTVEYGEKIKSLAQITGMGTDELQRLGNMANSEGVSIDSFGHSMLVLARNMNAAKGGSDEAAAGFSKVGVKVTDAEGKLRPLKDMWVDLADKFREMPDSTEKTAKAMKVLGKSGAEMIPLLNKSKEELEEYLNATVLSPDQIAASNDIITLQRKITAETKKLWFDVVGPMIPGIKDLLTKLLKWKKVYGEIVAVKIGKSVDFLVKSVGVLSDALELLVKNAQAVALIMGTGGLIWVFNALTIASVRAAYATTAAWVAANAPFVFIAATIAQLLMVIDDFREFGDKNSKKKTAIGAFQKVLLDWMQPKSGDSWFVVELKKMIGFIAKAIDALRDLELFFGGVEVAEARRKKSNPELFDQDGKYTGRRDVKVIPNSGGKLATIRRGAMTIDGKTVRSAGSKTGELDPEYGPTMPTISAPKTVPELRSGGGGGGAINLDINMPMTVTQLPGEQGTAFADRAMEAARKVLRGAVQEAVDGKH